MTIATNSKTHRNMMPPRRQRERRCRNALMPSGYLFLLISLLLGAFLLPGTHSFGDVRILPVSPSSRSNLARATPKNPMHTDSTILKACPSDNEETLGNSILGNAATETRRGLLARTASSAAAGLWLASRPTPASAAAQDDVKEMLVLLEQAKDQLAKVPSLIQEEKWDGVRGVLMEAPLRDCWSKSTPILKKYAEALGETPKGDELAALEGREDLLQHLRFLDMAVYNNVFNPIATEGKTGASKALIDSYYNDPTREYEASKRAIEGLIQLSNDAQ